MRTTTKHNESSSKAKSSPFFSPTTIQPKLTIGQPNDKYEQEADTMADKVMRMPQNGIQRACAGCEQEEGVQPKRKSNFLSLKRMIQRMGGMEEDKMQMKPQIQRMEGEEETLQTKPLMMKSEGGGGVATSALTSQLNSSKGGGSPLPASTNSFMSNAFGSDFSNVRVHTGSNAIQMNQGLNARAFTHGSDVYFNKGEYSPSSDSGKRLLGHELTHVVQQGGAKLSKPENNSNNVYNPINQTSKNKQISRVLNHAQINASIDFNRAHYDERSIRIIQIITRTNVDGIFGRLSAQTVAAFQVANGLVEDGKVGENTLNVMVPNRTSAAAGIGGRREHAIQLVIDFYNLDVTSDTLTVHFDPGLAVAGATTFESGNLRVIQVGTPALASAITLRDAINAQLTAPAPAAPAVGARPTHLTSFQELNSIRFNKRHFRDRRSVLTIQGLVGSNPDGLIGRDTVERIAEFQNANGLTIDGKIGDGETLPEMVDQLITTSNQNAAIRMIVDFYKMLDNGNLLDVRFDPLFITDNAFTDNRANEPVRVHIGPLGLAQPYAGIVHTIAHEYEHIRRLKEGITNVPTHEFLGEAIEILSVGMRDEDLDTGFANDAANAVTHWNNMRVLPADGPNTNQIRFRARFIAVRQRVRDRIAAGTPAQQALHAPLLARYNAAFVPPP